MQNSGLFQLFRYQRTSRQTRKDQMAESQSGFTLLEVLAVVLIIGVLAGIAAPGWVAFTNQRRVNAAQDRLLSALQDAQRQAKLKKVSYQTTFRIKDGLPQYLVHPVSVPATSFSDNFWQFLGESQQKLVKVVLGTNISGTGTNKRSSTSTVLDATTMASVTFDYSGALPTGSDTNLNITVAVPLGSTSTKPILGTRRCVVIQTLLGTFKTDRGTACNSW